MQKMGMEVDVGGGLLERSMKKFCVVEPPSSR